MDLSIRDCIGDTDKLQEFGERAFTLELICGGPKIMLLNFICHKLEKEQLGKVEAISLNFAAYLILNFE